MDMKIFGYIIASQYRINVLKNLREHEVNIPSKIAKECGIRQNHISKVLNDLKNKDLIVCLNPELKKGRIYKLTETGKKLIDYMEEI